MNPLRRSSPRSWVLGVFLTGSALVAAVAGVPDRPYVLLWAVGLIALTCWRNPQPWARFAWQWLPVLVIAAGYDLVRSFAPDLGPRAVIAPQRDFDEWLFGGTAPTVRLQDLLVDGGTPHWWDYGAWLFYLSHFVVTPAIAGWLYLRHRQWFSRYATLVLTVSLAAFVTYVVVPAVPPWMASRLGAFPHTVRIVHAVWSDLDFRAAAKVFAGSSDYANPVAALPSLHAAWPFLALLYLWSRTPRLRWVLLAYNAVMLTVLVYGAEHYVSDLLLGWVYAATAFVAVDQLSEQARRRRARRALVQPDEALATAAVRTSS